MRAKCLIEATEDGASFSFGSYSTARSYLAIARAFGSRHSRMVCWCSDSRRNAPSPLASRLMLRGRMRSIDSQRPGSTVDLQRRAAEPVEQQPAEGFEPRVAGDAEADQQLELRIGLEVGLAGAAVEFILELRQGVLIELGLAQLQHGLDGRHHAMAARLGEQRGVIAFRLVGVGAREIDRASAGRSRTGADERDSRSS